MTPKHIYTVKLRSLELEGTVKICSSYRKFEPPRSRKFREKKIWFWPGTVSLRFDNGCRVPWTFVVKIFNPLESSQSLQLLNTSGIFKRSLEMCFSLCSRSILYTENTRSGINTWIDIGIKLVIRIYKNVYIF